MRVCIFASSSSGNCLLVSHRDTNILVDAGISARRITTSLAQLGLSVENIGRVLITHEHSDHISGLKNLAKKSHFKVYAPHTIANKLHGMLPELADRIEIIPLNTAFSLGAVDGYAFHTSHDTDESVGYKFIADDKSAFAVATDTGCVTDEMTRALRGVDTVLLEANHDEQMLLDGAYPIYLKRRILSNRGHLSNDVSARFARELALSGTRQIILGHLSRDNNTPQKALATVGREVADLGVELACAPVLGLMTVHTGENVICSL